MISMTLTVSVACRPKSQDFGILDFQPLNFIRNSLFALFQNYYYILNAKNRLPLNCLKCISLMFKFKIKNFYVKPNRLTLSRFVHKSDYSLNSLWHAQNTQTHSVRRLSFARSKIVILLM